MCVFHIFEIVCMVPNRAKYLIHFKHQCPFKEEILMNNNQLTNTFPTKDLKLQTS